MTYRTRMCRLLVAMLFVLPISLSAATVVKSMVIFGDSLSDNGNTMYLLKSLRREENPAYLVNPLRVFIVNKMTSFAYNHHLPQALLDSSIEMVTRFFDRDLAPILASFINKIRQVPVLPAAPYWQGHFSNGQVWPEYLAPKIGLNQNNVIDYTNQAFGGSWASTYDYQLTIQNLIYHPMIIIKNLIVGKLIPPSLGLTIQAYLLKNPKLDNQTIYFVLTGGNDYLTMLTFADNYNPIIMSAYVDNVIGNIGNAINALTNAGAKHVVVLGLPKIGDAPRFNKTTDRDIINTAVQLHNERLLTSIQKLANRATDIDFLYIDTTSFLQKAIDNPAQFGFNNVTSSCLDIKLPLFNTTTNSPFAHNPVLQYAQTLQYHDKTFAVNEKNYYVCSEPQDYLFWDEVHPTTKAHSYLATDVCIAMKKHGYLVLCDK